MAIGTKDRNEVNNEPFHGADTMLQLAVSGYAGYATYEFMLKKFRVRQEKATGPFAVELDSC